MFSAVRNAPPLGRTGDDSLALSTAPQKDLPLMPGSNGHNPISQRQMVIDQKGAGAGGFGRGGAIKISGEKVISVRRLWEEVDAKRTRTQLAASSLRYLFWVIIYLVALYYQKNARDVFRTSDAMKAAFADAPFVHPITKVPMTFNDIRSVGDVWAFVEVKFVPTYYDLFWSNGDPKDEFYKMTLLAKNRVTHGMRWTQRRGSINQCTVTGKYNLFFPYCYPSIADGGKESIVNFGPYYDETKYAYTKYKHRYAEDENGFVIVMPFNQTQTQRELLTLRSDRWIDEATQWWQLDFTTYNPSTNLFAQVMLSVEFDISGQVRPRCEVAVMRSQVYMEKVRDYVQIVLEIIVMVGIFMYLLGNVKDYFQYQHEGTPGASFFGSLSLSLSLSLPLNFMNRVWTCAMSSKRKSYTHTHTHTHTHMHICNQHGGVLQARPSLASSGPSWSSCSCCSCSLPSSSGSSSSQTLSARTSRLIWGPPFRARKARATCLWTSSLTTRAP